jgi:uncharacterized protein
LSKSQIHIGDAGGKPVRIDLDTLISTKLLVQANSGGGKSWVLRRLIEQAFGKIQIIVIDPEGEFPTLREKYGFVLVGEGGETIADPRTAAVLAERLLTLHASAVCDLYELKGSARHEWVLAFLTALVEAPKKLWHPCLVIVDECHLFCPEKGEGESVAKPAMLDLTSRGRKRGFCGVWATQRLAKLDKSSSAEMQNRLVGPTFEDVDRERAIKLLGVLKADVPTFMREIQMLDPGNFYAIGRAITRERLLLKVGPVQTTHPRAGQTRIHKPPPAPQSIAKLLPQLEDLPKEAEQRANTERELRSKIRTLEAELRTAKSAIPKAAAPAKPVVDVAAIRAMGKSEGRRQLARELLANAGTMQRTLEMHGKIVKAFADKLEEESKRDLPKAAAAPVSPQPRQPSPPPPPPPPRRSAPADEERNGDSAGARTPTFQALLSTLAQNPNGLDRRRLAVLSKTSIRSSSFDKALAALRREQLIDGSDPIRITDLGIREAGEVPPPPSGPELVEHFMRQLTPTAQGLLKVLVEANGRPLSLDELSSRSGFSRTSSSFDKGIALLRALKLASGKGELAVAEELL